MHKTASGGNVDRWTYSCWVKIPGEVSGNQQLLCANESGTSHMQFYITNGNSIKFYDYQSSTTGMLETNDNLLRDPSAWYNIIGVWDTGNATAGNRMRIYINGKEHTDFATDTQPSSGQDGIMNKSGIEIEVAGTALGTEYAGYYLAEAVFIDGLALTPSSFGEFDEDSPTIWKPIDVSGLTFGTNGFYLDFEASGNLGNDANGGTDLDETGLAATDQSLDSPTNNFNIMLPIMKQASNLTFSEGNLAVAWPSANTWRTIYSSIMPTAGKWYFEAKNTTSNDNFIGMVGEAGVDNTDDSSISAPASAYSLKNDGNKYNNGSAASYGVSTTTNDIIGVAMDLDNGTIWFSKNGTWMNSATQAEVVAGTTTNAAYSSITVGAAYPYGIGASGKESAGFSFNFGSPPYAISSGNADDNGYGNFEYDVPTGFYSLCTKNLAEFG